MTTKWKVRNVATGETVTVDALDAFGAIRTAFATSARVARSSDQGALLEAIRVPQDTISSRRSFDLS